MTDGREEHVAGGYAHGELSAAFLTALTHHDADTRKRAERRVDGWRKVLSGVERGLLRVGRRDPVAGLPTWVTLDVLRGGFATGGAVAEGPLEPYEQEDSARLGLPADRAALFRHYLSDRGLAELSARLDSRDYDISVPEEAALLVVTWLVRAGNGAAAADLVDVLLPFHARLRFTPPPRRIGDDDLDLVSRETTAQVQAALAARRPPSQVLAMNEALTVWNPLADALLLHWVRLFGRDGLFEHAPDATWLAEAAVLLERYETAAAAHLLCRKHLRPKENLYVLRWTMAELVAGRDLDAAAALRLERTVRDMVRRRGLPDSPEFARLRAVQAADAGRPLHASLAHLVAERLDGYEPRVGLDEPELVLTAVTEAEADRTGLPAGWAVPDSASRVVSRARRGPIEQLLASGAVPSSEVLAELAPRIGAQAQTEAFVDEPLGQLMARHYLAFRSRRSLLLVDLAKQVQVDELPWVRAVAPHRRSDASGATGPSAADALRRLGQLAVDAFPGTLLPNRLVTELQALSQEAELELPWVEELAADIFMGEFTRKFACAAELAQRLLAGSFYDRYYGLTAASDTLESAGRAASAEKAFGRVCQERAWSSGSDDRWSVAANGRVIEQAQILTTQNLATLVKAGVTPSQGWMGLAEQSWQTVLRLVGQLEGNPRPLATVKNAAYAWRQMIFYLSLAEEDRATSFVEGISLDASPPAVASALGPFVDGLRIGGADVPRLLGWTIGRHPLLEARSPGSG